MQIIASGDKWIGYGIRTFPAVVKELIDKSEKSIIITIYMISDKIIIDNIKNALKRNVLVELFIYYPTPEINFNATNELSELTGRYTNLRIHKVEKKMLHAKVLVVDYKYLMIGSANLTFGGMIKNYELGVLIEDKEIASEVASLIKKV